MDQPLARLRSIALSTHPDTSGPGALLALVADLPVGIQDGNRWTTYPLESVDLALAGPDELPENATASINFKVADVPSTYQTLVDHGARPASEPQHGSHEIRASVWLTDGIALTVYGPLPQDS